MEIRVTEIRKGDRLNTMPGESGWTAISDAETIEGEPSVVAVDVQYKPDGGLGTREWLDPNIHVNIKREGHL